MPHTFTCRLAHVVFSTKDRAPDLWVHELFPERKRFGWQTGYGAFTVSGSRLDDVRNYIASQEEHHRKVSFQEEFLTLLEKHGLEYDVRDLWG